MPRTTPHRLGLVGAAALALVAAAAAPVWAGRGPAEQVRVRGNPVTLRLGYFPNVTHATALVGVEGGIYKKVLGSGVDLQLKTFTSGTPAVAAIQAGALDATYIGPNPTITAWAQLEKGVRIVSGAASGGAYFVVKPSINSAADLKGKAVGSPGLGNTQDLSLRSWLKSKGLKTDTTGGGDVSIKPQDNALALGAFQRGDIVGDWVPEPWATQFVQAGAKILVDESTLWPQGKFVTTQLIVTTSFLKAHKAVVQKLVNAQVQANDYVNSKVADSQLLVSKGIQNATGKPIDGNLVIAAFRNVEFTNDPISGSLVVDNKTQGEFGFPNVSSLKGIYDLSFLNKALKAADEPTVTAGLTAPKPKT